MTYEYSNIEMKYQKDGKKIVRKVYMKNGKGYKTVTKYGKRGQKLGTVKKSIHDTHAEQIKMGRFVPGLFADCLFGRRTRKNSGIP